MMPTLIASVPMATRTDRHRLSGNHVDNLYLPLRNDVLDPRRRIESIRESSIAARQPRARRHASATSPSAAHASSDSGDFTSIAIGK